MKTIQLLAGQAELDKILAAIPESDLIELCCLHADKKSAEDALRGAYEDVSFLWGQIKDRPYEDFPNALKAFVSLLNKGVNRSDAAKKFAELPMLLRKCRAFDLRNEIYEGSEGFLGALDEASESDALAFLEPLKEYLSNIGECFSAKCKKVKLTKMQIVRRPSSRGSKKSKSIEEVKTTEDRIAFPPALRALLPGSRKKNTSQIQARFARWNATDSRYERLQQGLDDSAARAVHHEDAAHGLRGYPNEQNDIEFVGQKIADEAASERLKGWKEYGFNKVEFLNVAHRVFLWTKIDVREGRCRKIKPSDNDEESKLPKAKKKRKSGQGRVRNKKHDKRLGNKLDRLVQKRRSSDRL